MGWTCYLKPLFCLFWIWFACLFCILWFVALFLFGLPFGLVWFYYFVCLFVLLFDLNEGALTLLGYSIVIQVNSMIDLIFLFLITINGVWFICLLTGFCLVGFVVWMFYCLLYNLFDDLLRIIVLSGILCYFVVFIWIWFDS